MDYQIKRGNAVVATVIAQGKFSSKIMGDEKVDVSFSLHNVVTFQVDDSITVDNNAYFLNTYEPQVKKIDSHNYEYNLVFEGIKYKLIDKLIFFPDANNALTIPEFSIMGNANTIMDLIIRNCNVDGLTGWTKGVIDDTPVKLYTFNGHNALSALSYLAEETGLEYWVDGNKSMHLTKRKAVSGLVLQMGALKGIKHIERIPYDASTICTRLYAYGSERNVKVTDPKANKRLTMDVPYLEKNTGIYGIKPQIKKYDDIYPRRVGTVTAVDAANPLIFTDSTIDFDLNAADAKGNTTILIPNVSAKVSFITGQCAGYTFEIREYGYNTATKTFTLLKNKDEKALEVPNALLKPAVGDTYVLLDIIMPANYELNAKAELKTKAQADLDLNSKQRNIYKVESDPLDFKLLNVNLTLGNTVQVIETDFNLNANLRVISIIKDLQNPYAVDFDLDETVTQSNIIRADIESEKKEAALNRAEKWNAEQARRNYEFSKEIRDNTFDKDGYFNTGKIKPLSIETKYLSVGSRSQLVKLLNMTIKMLDNTTLQWTAGQCTHLTISDAGPKTWNILSGTQNNIPDTYHYVYVKAAKATVNATVLVSTQQFSIDADSDFYYFEIGAIGTVNKGFRKIKIASGFTDINAGELTTGKITKPSTGETLLDVDEGKFYGPVIFSSGQNAETALANTNTIAANAQSVAIQANTGQMAANSKIDNLRVGNVNLITDSSFERYRQIYSYGASSSCNIEISSVAKHGSRAHKCTFIRDSSQGMCGVFLLQDDKGIAKIIKGKDVVFFAYVKAEGAAVGRTAFSHIYTDVTSGNGANVTLNGEWQKLTIFFQARQNINTIYTYIFGDFQPGDVIYVDCIYLSIGNVDVDWIASPEDVQAQIDEAKAKAAEADYLKTALANDTTVQSGLIGTTLIRLGAKNQNGQWIERAGSNGAPGTGTTPRFYAGGNLLQAQNRANGLLDGAKFVVTEDGKVYAIDVELAGSFKTAPTGERIELDQHARSIIIFDATDKPKVKIEAAPISPLSALLSYNSAVINPVISTSAIHTGTTSSYVYSADLVLPATSSNYTVTTPEILGNVRASEGSDSGNAEASCYAYLITPNETITLGNISANRSEENKEIIILPRTFTGMPAGTYKIKLTASAIAAGHAASASATIKIEAPKNDFKGESIVNVSRIFNNGFLFITDASHYQYECPTETQIKKGNTIFKVSDSGVEGAGVIASAKIQANNIIDNRFNSKILTSSNNGSGLYTITHNLGHTRYLPSVIPITADYATATVVSIDNNTCQVQLRRNGGGANMDFILTLNG